MGWFTNLFTRRRFAREIEEELASHLAEAEDAGRDSAEARRAFGSAALVAEQTREAHTPALTGVLGDLRYALRSLRREPAFAVTAIVSLTLGIGAACSVFSIADAILLRPLPYLDSDRIVWASVRFPSAGNEFVPSPDFVAWRRDNHVFSSLAATQAGLSITMLLGGAAPDEVHAARVSANFLDVFATAPVIGRSFTAAEESPNGPRATLLTDQFWRNHFHANPAVVGSAISLDGQAYRVIGILPRSFVYPFDVKIDLLTTLAVNLAASHRDRSMSTWAVFGRLKPNVTMAQAHADIEQLFARSRADFPPLFRKDAGPVLETLREHRVADARILLLILMAAAGCLLAIACANVANLLLARWSSRSQELAVRAAIGAGRGRLARQLFLEIAVLIALSTLGALLLATLSLRVFVRFAGSALPRLTEIDADWRVFSIGLAFAAGTAFLFGILPVLRAGRADLQEVLQRARGGSLGSHALLRRTMVATEVALSVVLLSGAGLLFQTLWRLRNDHLGFQTENVLTVSIPARQLSPAARDALATDAESWIRRIPGVEAAALTQCTPLSTGSSWGSFSRSDRPLPEPFHRGDDIGVCGVAPDYLHATGVRLLQGRFIDQSDALHPATVAVINQAAAHAYFPGESPIGKQILGMQGHWKTVVGVIADTKNQGLSRPPAPGAFVNDFSYGPDNLLFVVRTLAGEASFATSLRQEIQQQRPGVFARIETLDDAIGKMTAPPRFDTLLLATFAAIAFLMAIVGVYGVTAFSVTQRRREIGVRTALGATPAAVVRLIMREGGLLLVIGGLAGLGGAAVLTRYLKSLLYGVKPADPFTLTAVVIVLAIATAAASFLPALRAARIDPLEALRHE